MIEQGGDAMKNGSGEAGYVIPDEVWAGATHDHAGQLCMANRGKNTNSAQFFITDAAALHLDSGYTIFGECGPVDVVHTIASVEVQGQRPKTAVDIKKITVTRSRPEASSSLDPPGSGPHAAGAEGRAILRACASAPSFSSSASLLRSRSEAAPCSAAASGGRGGRLDGGRPRHWAPTAPRRRRRRSRSTRCPITSTPAAPTRARPT